MCICQNAYQTVCIILITLAESLVIVEEGIQTNWAHYSIILLFMFQHSTYLNVSTNPEYELHQIQQGALKKPFILLPLCFL